MQMHNGVIGHAVARKLDKAGWRLEEQLPSDGSDRVRDHWEKMAELRADGNRQRSNSRGCPRTPGSQRVYGHEKPCGDYSS